MLIHAFICLDFFLSPTYCDLHYPHILKTPPLREEEISVTKNYIFISKSTFLSLCKNERSSSTITCWLQSLYLQFKPLSWCPDVCICMYMSATNFIQCQFYTLGLKDSRLTLFFLPLNLFLPYLFPLLVNDSSIMQT